MLKDVSMQERIIRSLRKGFVNDSESDEVVCVRSVCAQCLRVYLCLYLCVCWCVNECVRVCACV